MMKVVKLILTFSFVCSTFVLPLGAQQPKPPAKEAATQPPPQQQPAQPVTPVDRTLNVVAQNIYTERGDYLLGPNDVLLLKVYGEPQFDTDLVVEEDGTVVLPFLDEPLQVKCRKVNAVKKDVVAALSVLLKNPKVELRLKERRSRKPATVYGAVRSPLQFDMQRRARLLELLSNSGGVTEQHSGTIQIMHTEPPMCDEPIPPAPAKVETGEDAIGIPFEIYKVADLKQGKPEANPYIRHGDIIYVAEATPIYIVGNVVQPSNLYLREGMTLTRALATVGGLREGADQTKIKIYRLDLGTMTQQEMVYDFKAIKQNKAKDVVLQPYDIIEVPMRGFTAKDLLKMVTGIAQTSVQSLGSGVGYRILY